MWWGLGISNLGTQLTAVAVGLEVYSLTGSTLAVGILGICALVPLVVLGLYGGALVDHFDRRKVALLASTALLVVTALLAAQAWAGVDSVGVLYALVAMQSAASAVNNPARSAIIPRLVPPTQLAAANALQTLAWNVALTGGPLLGAALVAWHGYEVAYTLDMVLFVASLYALWRLPDLPPKTPDGAAPVGRRGVGLSSVLDGLRYLGTRPNLRMTFLLDLSAMVLAMPRVLFPAVGGLVDRRRRGDHRRPDRRDRGRRRAGERPVRRPVLRACPGQGDRRCDLGVRRRRHRVRGGVAAGR
ncbi:MFS transporter [Occultella kanbiaonis]|uniref:MFS transporter n=1 Tax=Occultella kanbiaonis TaxID=2675754 RepID=UPI002E27C201|nr:MFS transporter [Occultella kanbiaonis]